MRKYSLFLVFVIMLTALAGCGASPQEDAAEKYAENVEIELLEVTDGIAFYAAYISNDFGWDNAGPTRQCTIAQMAVDECEELRAAGADFPLGATAHEISVMGYTENGYTAFSCGGGSSVTIYTNESRDQKTYKFSDILG